MKRLLSLLFLFSAGPAQACTVCFGDPNSSMNRAIWPGVYFLLGVVGLVLGSVAYLGWTWLRRDEKSLTS